jgi:hypothetical protein
MEKRSENEFLVALVFWNLSNFARPILQRKKRKDAFQFDRSIQRQSMGPSDRIVQRIREKLLLFVKEFDLGKNAEKICSFMIV